MKKSLFDPKFLRKIILDFSYNGSTVHIPCAFSLVEILAVLYRGHVRLGESIEDPSRDFLVLSKGHGVMAQYACLYELGVLNDLDVKNYFSNGTDLKGLSDVHVKGLEVTSGSLGHGLSVGVGLALGCKLAQTDRKVFVIVGDGECNEGSIWEALLFSGHWRLDNLIVIVDANGFQAMGTTEEVMHLSNIESKLRAFDFDATSVDGHDEAALDRVITDLINRQNGRPKAIVAHTVKGKGISFMENDNRWHYTRLTDQTYRHALEELGYKVSHA